MLLDSHPLQIHLDCLRIHRCPDQRFALLQMGKHLSHRKCSIVHHRQSNRHHLNRCNQICRRWNFQLSAYNHLRDHHSHLHRHQMSDLDLLGMHRYHRRFHHRLNQHIHNDRWSMCQVLQGKHRVVDQLHYRQIHQHLDQATDILLQVTHRLCHPIHLHRNQHIRTDCLWLNSQ